MMNLKKLFEVQKVLRDRINYNEPDRFNKLVLALLVELGECANEWRGFKFWSKDQKARTFGVKGVGHGIATYNPLLEEYVDGLHFVLELGIELGFDQSSTGGIFEHNVEVSKSVYGVTEQFTNVFEQVSTLNDEYRFRRNRDEFEEYEILLYLFFGLGEMLGFTWEQIEQAYFEKNKVNHQRQSEGY
jgi:dimeric dUTPase (all-alpha-NTP-PPase superfamily)